MKLINNLLFTLLLTLGSTCWAQEVGMEEAEQEVVKPSEIELEVKETKYVTDKLRLSLYKNANSNSGTLKLLISGDVLQVLERSGLYSRVRTNEGLIGWVKNGFLVSNPTASFQLSEQQKQNEALVAKLEKFSDTKTLVRDYEKTIKKISDEKETSQQELADTKQLLERANLTIQELQEQVDQSQHQQGKINWNEALILTKRYWYILLIIFLIPLIAGFIAGKEMIEAQLRRRFQGVKVL